MHEITQILQAIDGGNARAAADLLPLVYEELRQLAAQKLAQEKPGQTLQATALVHEAYLRILGDDDGPHWNGRGHFFAAAAEAMRRILVEQARRKHRERHGSGRVRVPLDGVEIAGGERDEDLLALDEALESLMQTDGQAAEVVKLRYFAGLTIEQTAEALGSSVRMVNRHFAFAKAWLYRHIHQAS